MPSRRRLVARRRRRRVFCVGLAKSGTHSLAEMLAPTCKVAHEPESEDLLPLLAPVRSGAIVVGELRPFLLARDHRLRLDVEANHLLSSFVPHLLDAFPDSRYLLLVRDCRDWIDSMINDQLNLREWDGYARWRVVYDQYLAGENDEFVPHESMLRDLGLYPLRNYVRFWTEEVQRVTDAVPADRLLVLPTASLTIELDRLAAFVGVPRAAIAAERSHAYTARRSHDVLNSLDAGYIHSILHQPATART